MMQKTDSPLVLLQFLRNFYYQGLPRSLWNHRLWFYRSLLPLMNEAITGEERHGVSMFVEVKDGATCGIGFVRLENEDITAIVAADNDRTTQELLDAIIRDRADVTVAEVSTYTEVQTTRSSTIGKYLSGTCGYWTNVPAPVPPEKSEVVVRELVAADVVLFDQISFPDGSRGWPEFVKYLAQGLRYFGTLVDGSLVSTAGLCQTTIATSEIIAVGTIEEANRQKGYATLCASQALQEGLSMCDVCTWTCNCDNMASRKTAEKLGMRMSFEYARYRIRDSSK